MDPESASIGSPTLPDAVPVNAGRLYGIAGKTAAYHIERTEAITFVLYFFAVLFTQSTTIYFKALSNANVTRLSCSYYFRHAFSRGPGISEMFATCRKSSVVL